MAVGIEMLNVYGGVARIPVGEVFAGRGLRADRFGNLMATERAVALPFEDPVTNAVNAAAPVLERLGDAGRDSIQLLIVATESGVDLSKSVTSYVHRHLGLPANCRILEVKQACYAGTGALQLALGYLAGAGADTRALLICTDVAVVGAEGEYAEPATGTGAVAMLLGDRPRVFAPDPGAFGCHAFETLDSARPHPDTDIVDVDQSLLAYLTCAVESFRDYRDKVEGADLRTTFDQLALHSPFAGMVKAAHRRLMRDFCGAAPADVEADFARRVAPSLSYPGVVGNLFAGSLYLALAGLIDTVRPRSALRVGMFSYGSGCIGEFFSGVTGPEATAELAAMDIGGRLARRRVVGFDEYVRLQQHAEKCLVPTADRSVDVDEYRSLVKETADRPFLALVAVERYHRRYEWI